MNAPERLHFRAADHSYWLGDGRLPAVSDIIAPLDGFRNGAIPGRYLEEARARGTAVHRACELDDEGDLDERSVDASLRPYLAAWRGFSQARIAEMLAIEQPLASKRYHYAGTPDRVARLVTDHLAILDVKTGAPQSVHAIQTAAYAELAAEHYEDRGKRVKRFAVQLSGNGKFKLHEFKDAGDFGVFLACLSVWRWREAHR